MGNSTVDFDATVKFNGTDYTISIYVVEGPQSSDMLARKVAHKSKLISRVDETSFFVSCGLVKCNPMKSTLKNDVKPCCLMTAHLVPFPLFSKVEEELARMEKEGII